MSHGLGGRAGSMKKSNGTLGSWILISDILFGLSNMNMMFGRMMFCSVISMIVGTFIPKDF